jgi:hypothetical protein
VTHLTVSKGLFPISRNRTIKENHAFNGSISFVEIILSVIVVYWFAFLQSISLSPHITCLSGGPKIIIATAQALKRKNYFFNFLMITLDILQVIINYLELGMNLLGAVRAPRVHSQLLPDSVEIEDQTLVLGLQITIPAFIVEGLTERGHHNATLVNKGMGVTQFIVRCDAERPRLC